MAALAGSVGRVGIIVGKASVGIVGASSMTMSVIQKKHGWVLKAFK